MAVLTREYQKHHSLVPSEQEWPVAASTKIFKGALVSLDANGYVINATSAIGTYVIGMAAETADNSSGANGAISIPVHFRQIVEIPVSGSFDQSYIGKKAYVVDNNTVQVTDNGAIAGIFHEYKDGIVFVFVNPLFEGTNYYDDYAAIGIDLTSLRQADMAAMGITETVGDHYIDNSTNVVTLYSETANNNTKDDTSVMLFRVPNDFTLSSTGDIKVNFSHILEGAGTGGTCTVDVEAYKQSDGAVGSDLVTTAAIATTTSWQDASFTIDSSGLSRGDSLVINIKTSTQETALANLQTRIENLFVTYDKV